jgi:predicted amidophosphoribosyltransferase
LPTYVVSCWHGQVLDEALDLFLGSRCVGCDLPGRMLCPGCRDALAARPRVAWPTPVPDGLVTPWVAAAYDGAVRALVVGHKDRGQWGHRRVLGDLLAQAVHGAAADLDPCVPLLLVPVPSRPGAGRRRGYEATEALVRRAAFRVRRERPAAVVTLLVSRGAADQAGLDAGGRAANVAGSMHCPSATLARAGRRWSRAHVLVCDDVVTTGSTAREAQRALESVGLPPVAVAAVAATRRRSGPAAAPAGLPLGPTGDPPVGPGTGRG